MCIGHTSILSNFSVDFTIAWDPLVGIFVNEAGLKIRTNILELSKLLIMAGHIIHPRSTIQIPIDCQPLAVRWRILFPSLKSMFRMKALDLTNGELLVWVAIWLVSHNLSRGRPCLSKRLMPMLP
jgi:hypothetical protein